MERNVSNIKDYTISFVAKDEDNNPVSDVELDMNNGSIYTDAEGKAQFIVNNLGNPYSYTTLLTGYTSVSANYIATKDTTITIILEQSSTATFNVSTQSGNPVEGIAITFNDSSKSTNASGKAVFYNLGIGNQYPFSVINNSEYIDFGTVYVNQLEQTINISYQSDAITSVNESSNTIYPNPASDYIHIISGNTINSVKIFNISELLILGETFNSNEIEIPVQSLEKRPVLCSG